MRANVFFAIHWDDWGIRVRGHSKGHCALTPSPSQRDFLPIGFRGYLASWPQGDAKQPSDGVGEFSGKGLLRAEVPAGFDHQHTAAALTEGHGSNTTSGP